MAAVGSSVFELLFRLRFSAVFNGFRRVLSSRPAFFFAEPVFEPIFETQHALTVTYFLIGGGWESCVGNKTAVGTVEGGRGEGGRGEEQEAWGQPEQ